MDYGVLETTSACRAIAAVALSLVWGGVSPVWAYTGAASPSSIAPVDLVSPVPLEAVTNPRSRAVSRPLLSRPDGTVRLLGARSWLLAHERMRLREGGPGWLHDHMAVLQVRRYIEEVTGGRVSSRHLLLLGVEPVDGDRVVNMTQAADGVRIVGTHVVALVGPSGIRYVRHRLAAPPRIEGTATLDAHAAGQLAEADIAAHAAAAVLRPSSTELVIASSEKLPNRLAWQVDVQSEAPWGLWRLTLDARTGELIGRRKISLDGVQGTVSFEVEPVCQGQGTELVGMPHVRWADGKNADDAGSFFDSGTASQAQVELSSPYFALRNRGGSVAGPWTFALQSLPAHNALEITDAPLDQVGPFYHAHKVRGWVRGRVDSNNAQKRWTESQVRLTINIPESCNAYYDGNINFFAEGDGCLNTGRIAGIVYHEYGHGVHDHSGGPEMDGQVSEGISDYVAATILNDPTVRGIPRCNSSFRTCDNDYTYCSSGCDYGPRSSVHAAGQVVCAVLWEIRQQLIDRYGYDLGVSTADRIMLKYLTLVGDATSSYDAMVAADDDDDDDPSNGTTHSCEINKAFADDEGTAHFPDLVGLVPSQPSLSIEHDPPGLVEPAKQGGGGVVEIPFELEYDPGCAADAELTDVVFHYRPFGETEDIEIPLDPPSGGSGGSVSVRATVGGLQPPVTLEYYLTAKLGDADFIYPVQSPKAPVDSDWPYWRQMLHYGAEETLYFSDFEQDDGGLVPSTTAADDRSDWEWGAPDGMGGDPSQAHSGSKLWGTDLGQAGDGQYDRGRVSYLDLPPIDAKDFGHVRLQFWRHLLSSDEAKVLVNGEEVYVNRAGAFFWRDPGFMFHDIDISAEAGGKDSVSIRFVMKDAFADTFELGGWNLDDVRVAGTRGGVVHQEDGPVEPSYEVDDISTGCRMGIRPPGFLHGIVVLLLVGLVRTGRRRSARAG